MRRIIQAALIGSVLVTGQLSAVAPAEAGSFDVRTVGPFGVDSFVRYFQAGELVTVFVSGDGRTDLDLYVYCPCSRIVAQDDDGSDDCLASFVAPESGYYIIKVVNRGGWSNTYTISIN